MASARRWSVSAGRTVISGLLAVVAVFLMFVSLGAGSWVLAALGAAVLAAAVAFYVVAALNSREFAYVPGTGHVVSCSPPPAAASQGRCEMHLVIHAPGIDDVAVKIRDAGVPVSKWPDAGATLPILVAVGDPRRVRVLWDSVRSHGEVAEGRDQEYQAGGREVADSYLGDMLDEDYDDVALAGIDPDTRVLEMNVMPIQSSGPGYSSSISYDPDIGLDPDVLLDRHVEMGDAPREPRPPRESPRRVPPDPDEPGPDELEPDELEPDELEPDELEAQYAGPPPEEPDAEAGAPPAPRVAPDVRPRPRPSPRPRRPADDQIPVGGSEPDAAGGVATLPAPPEQEPELSPPERDANLPPLRVEHVLAADPAVPAMPDSPATGTGDDVSDAYLAAARPPGQPRGRVRGVGVTLFVANLGRSLAFYRDLLGFRQVDLGLGSAVLESGDARIVLRRVVDMPPVDRRLIHLLLEVPDVQAAYDELLLQGVEFVHRPRLVSRFEELELWSATFRDPDGHGIALTKWAVVPSS